MQESLYTEIACVCVCVCVYVRACICTSVYMCKYTLCAHVCVTGNTLNVQTGQWTSNVAGLGAGMDSFYEYLLKVNSITKLHAA